MRATNHLHVPSEPVWQPSVFALKASGDFGSLAELRVYLLQSIPQNSEATRRRTMQYIVMRFFPDGDYNSLPRRVWLAYRNEGFLESIMRYYFLARERLVGRFVEEVLNSLEPGTTFDRTLIEQFVRGVYSDPARIKKAVSRVQAACRELGLVETSQRGKAFRVLALGSVSTPLLVLLHHIFAPTPRTVTMVDILSNPFWKDIGMRSVDAVRQSLKEATAKDLLNKYVVADQLEQVTTKYTLDEFLAERMQV